MKVAVLLTCFNRKDKTKACLANLFEQELPRGYDLSVFICDDGSTDGTADMLGAEFPQVNLVKGNGQLYWGGGMRMAWGEASKKDDFDFFLWLNDDTFLKEKALINLFKDNSNVPKNSIITAACNLPGKEEFSYGGLQNKTPVIPNGQPQRVSYINGNLVLIPKNVFDKIGNISEKYTHYLGDYDYGLRAIKAGIGCFTTSTYLAECAINAIPYWGDPKLTFRERWQWTHNVKGMAINEYVRFVAEHDGYANGIKTWVMTYLRVFFPEFFIRTRDALKSSNKI